MSDLSFYTSSVAFAMLIGVVIGIVIGRNQVAVEVCGPQFDIDGTIYGVTELVCLVPVDAR